jgi:hypothetical protein
MAHRWFDARSPEGSARERDVSASDELELSADGVTWSEDFTGTLFDGLVLVPGAEATATVWVRNAAPDMGDLRFAATRLDVSSGLAEAVTMDVTVSGPAGERSSDATIAELLAEPRFVVADEVEAGGVRRVEVTLRMATTAPNDVQIDDLQFSLEVTLSEAVAEVPGVPSGSSGGGLGPMPATGAAIGSTLVIAAIGVAAGSWFRLAGRRRARHS